LRLVPGEQIQHAGFYVPESLEFRYARPGHDQNIRINKKVFMAVKNSPYPSLIAVPVHAFFKSFFGYIRRKQPCFTAARSEIYREAVIAVFFPVFKQEAYILTFGGVVDNETPI
jgi:hypothetical protein